MMNRVYTGRHLWRGAGTRVRRLVKLHRRGREAFSGGDGGKDAARSGKEATPFSCKYDVVACKDD